MGISPGQDPRPAAPSLTQVVARSRAALAEGTDYEVIVVGGGITGAGIARESARRGWRTLLLERGDFAGGTSSLSSKMVHGGLRYLASGQWRLSREAARQREDLTRRWPDLITPTPYYYLYRRDDWGQRIRLPIGLALFHWLSREPRRHHPRPVSAEALRQQFAPLCLPENTLAWQYHDALCDDSALVLRTLQEAAAQGADLCHYTPVTRLLRQEQGVTGVWASLNGQAQRLRAKVVINATGVWADGLASLPEGYRLRPLRGSHLMFRRQDLPLSAALTLHHPDDNRVVFCYPWGGQSVIGTTDLDHLADKQLPARISLAERDYLLALLPQLGLSADLPILASWSGLRPILQRDGQPTSPSAASREHLIWEEPGLVNITGGKLTTFVPMAEAVLARAEAQGRLPLQPHQADLVLGPTVPCVHASLEPDPLPLAELAYWAEHGAIEQLEDLLLRRTRMLWRLGDRLEQYQGPIRGLCQARLGWSDRRWQAQWQRMLAHNPAGPVSEASSACLSLSR